VDTAKLDAAVRKFDALSGRFDAFCAARKDAGPAPTEEWHKKAAAYHEEKAAKSTGKNAVFAPQHRRAADLHSEAARLFSAGDPKAEEAGRYAVNFARTNGLTK
jgi:hypothetical protein